MKDVAPASTLLAAAIGTCVVIYLIQTIFADFCAMRTLWLVKDMRRIKKIMRRVNMSGTITNQDLLDRGFKEYSPAYPIDHDGIETKFQKRYDDEVGKRYFINVSKWKPFFDSRVGETWGGNYEYDVYFQKDDGNGGTKAIKILLYAGWDVDEVEEYVRKLFETGLFEYYEKWEDC